MFILRFASSRQVLGFSAVIFTVLLLLQAITVRFADTAFFGGDTWEYQSMGVNLARGHGLRFGGIEAFENYAFQPTKEAPPYLERFERLGREGGLVSFYRTPGYPVFLAGIYATVGVHPAAVRHLQLAMIALAASLLPFIGWRIWGKRGFGAGALAALPYYFQRRELADPIMTEPLIIFMLLALVLSCLAWDRRRTPGHTLAAGAMLGLGLLVKGSLIFLPPLLAAAMVWRARSSLTGLLFLVGVAAPILPYSMYATSVNGSPVFLSTQGSVVFLDGNNEASIRTGGWAPEWKSDSTSFYNRPDIRERSTFGKIAAFYAAQPGALPIAIGKKLVVGFQGFRWLKAGLILMWSLLLASVIRSCSGRKWVARGGLLVGAWFAWKDYYFPIVLWAGAIPAGAWLWALARRPEHPWRIGIEGRSFPLAAIFLNFLLLTIGTLGEPRFVVVADFVFVLAACDLLLRTWSVAGLPPKCGS